MLLCEQGDLAGATSSASSKLIHGGLRYLEHYAFRFVREALIEQDVLLGIAPHLVSPLEFVLPHEDGVRPAWLVSLGLFLYDRLRPRRRLPRSRRLDLRRCSLGAPLDDRFRTGFAYYDAFVDDSRLVVLNALDAHERGAEIRTRTRLVAAAREGALWRADLLDLRDNSGRAVSARALVNATGPWVGEVRALCGAGDHGNRLRLLRGSHIVLPRLYPGNHAYILQNDDRRVVFVIPFERDFSLVGTTEIPFDGDPARAAIGPAEVEYLCRAVSRYFRKPTAPDQVVHGFSGVRPLFDDRATSPSAVTREFVLELDAPSGEAPLVSVFGGKVTTYRHSAEQAVDLLAKHLDMPRPGAWTSRVPLPGGDLADRDLGEFSTEVRAAYPFLPDATVTRLAHAYGTRLHAILGKARSTRDLGGELCAGLTRAEVDHLIDHEWAETAEDLLWRRTKLGLIASAEQYAAIETYVAQRIGEGAGHG